MNYMLDACALIALLNGEADKMAVVKDLLTQARQGKTRLFMSIVNFTEVYYDRLKLERPDLTNAFLEYSMLLPITILETCVIRSIQPSKSGNIRPAFRRYPAG
ncbi:hypothetical protein FACS189445_1710 [Spirochaetia bacterium]|nr:hypothetical protein FACS189445_1710 [Spirochaetia bacterium]